MQQEKPSTNTESLSLTPDRAFAKIMRLMLDRSPQQGRSNLKEADRVSAMMWPDSLVHSDTASDTSAPKTEEPPVSGDDSPAPDEPGVSE